MDELHKSLIESYESFLETYEKFKKKNQKTSGQRAKIHIVKISSLSSLIEAQLTKDINNIPIKTRSTTTTPKTSVSEKPPRRPRRANINRDSLDQLLESKITNPI